MASRLSDYALKQAYEGGARVFPWKGHQLPKIFAESEIDLRALAADPKAPQIIPQLEPAKLYRALMRHGPEDAVDLIPYLSEEQFQRILDYDVWHQDQIAPKKVFQWLKLARETSPEEQFRRFRDLDEEYQLAVMGPMLRVVDKETYDKLSSAEQDALTPFPGQEIWYQILVEEKELYEDVRLFLEAAMSENIAYTMMLMATASFIPPNEQEHLIGQFRKARLEEDGFVSYEESLDNFRALPEFVAMRRRWREEEPHQQEPLSAWGEVIQASALQKQDQRDGLLLDKAISLAMEDRGPEFAAHMVQSFAYFANSLATSCGITPDDVKSIERLLLQARSYTNLALDYLSQGDERRAAEILVAEYPKKLLRFGLTLLQEVQKQLIRCLDHYNIVDAIRWFDYLQAEKRGLLLHQVDLELAPSLGHEAAEILKAAFNRFPMVRRGLLTESKGEMIRFEFAPLATLTDLEDFCLDLESLLVPLEVAVQAGGRPGPGQDFDKLCRTALVRFLGGSRFEHKPLTESDLGDLLAVSAAPLRSKASDLYETLASRLEQSPRAPWRLLPVLELEGEQPHVAATERLKSLVALGNDFIELTTWSDKEQRLATAKNLVDWEKNRDDI